MSAPDKIIICTKGAIASNFADGTIFLGVQEHADALGTVDYVRQEAVIDILNLARSGEIDGDLRSLIHRVKTL